MTNKVLVPLAAMLGLMLALFSMIFYKASQSLISAQISD
jgi:hypothetical protein